MARSWTIWPVLLLAGLAAQSVAAQTPAGETASRTTVAAPPGFLASCDRYAWLCDGAPSAVEMGGEQLLALARAVNRRVNRSVVQLSDVENHGVEDHWTLPENGRGDCEDMVLRKYRLLLDAGVDGRDLAIAVALDRHGENHAVLVLRHASGDLVLDSLRARIVPWNETGYRFLAMQRAGDPNRWAVVAGQPRTSRVLASR